MKKLQKNLFVLLLFLISFVNAQTPITLSNRQDYEDRRIYLKVKDTLSVELAYPVRNLPIPPNLVPIYDIFQKYHVTLVEKPFASLGTKFLQKAYRITFDPILKVEEFISELKSITFVESAAKIPLVSLSTIYPNDPLLKKDNTDPLMLAKVYDAFDIFRNGGAKIAIIDNAFLTSHEDLTGGLIHQRDMADQDDNVNPPFIPNPTPFRTHQAFSHGTHIAGIIGGRTDNGKGIASVGWQNQIIAIKIIKDNTKFPKSFQDQNIIYDAIKYAVDVGAKVINLSLGGYGYDQSGIEYNVLKAVRDKGIIVVASAGNDNTLNPVYPAAYGSGLTQKDWDKKDESLVIAVASVDISGERSSPKSWGGSQGSNYGSWIDIAAYGTNILSTVSDFETNGVVINNKYDYDTGTSMAAPMVAGLAGLMLGYIEGKSNYSAVDVINCLLSTANPDVYTIPGNQSGTLGYGRLDAYEALRCLTSTCTTPNNFTKAFIYSDKNVICNNSNLLLKANQGKSYIWSNGETSQNTVINQAGTYSVTITFNGGCTSVTSKTITTPTARILVNEVSGLLNDGIACSNDYIELLADNGDTYSWTAPAPIKLPNSALVYASPTVLGTSTYTVTINNVGGCEGLNQVLSANITYNPIPTALITISETSQTLNDGIICPNSDVTLSCSHVLGNLYLWSNGSTLSSIVVSPSITTTYVVTITNANGCSVKSEKTIYVLCSDFIFNKTTDNCYEYYNFESESITNAKYYWEVKIGNLVIETSTEAKLKIAFPINGIYTIIHKISLVINSSNTIENTSTKTVSVTVPRNVLKNNAQTSTNLGVLNTNGQTTGSQFTVTGDYYIDKDYTFKDCDFYMTEGARIIINKDIRAEFSESCTFQSCGTKLWRGIEMAEGAELVFKGNTIEDADYALVLAHQATVEISGNTFNANHIGLYAYPKNNGKAQVNQVNQIKGNTFKCDRILKPINTPWVEYPNVNCIGVCLNDLIGVRIGGQTVSESNDFTKLDCAIISNRSDLNIQYANISNLTPFSPLIVTPNGVGVYFKEGANSISNSNFNNLPYGIMADNDNSTIEKNTMNDVVSGMYILFATQKETYIRENTINFGGVGIYVGECNQPIFLDLWKNRLYNNSANQGMQWWDVGVYLSNILVDVNSGYADVSNSTIEMGSDSYKTGILASGVQGFILNDNKIRLNSNYSFGIGVSGYAGTIGENKIVQNIIQGNSPDFNGYLAYPSHIGIAAGYAPEDYYYCNQVFNTEVGISFNGYSNNTDFGTSVLHNHHRGLVLGNDAIIGPQDHTGNQWLATISPLAEAFHDSDDKNIIDQSTFRVTQGNSFEPSPILMPNAPPNTQWIRADGTPSQFCQTFISTNNDPIEIGEADEAIAAGTLYDNTTFEAANTFEAKHHLMSKLDRLGNLNGLSPNLRAFYDNTKDAPLGVFYKLQKRIENTMKGSVAFQQSHRIQLLAMDTLRATINQLSQQLATATGENKEILEQQRRLLYTQLAAKHSAAEANYLQYVIGRNDALYVTLADFNNFDAGNNVVLQNEKTFYENYISLLMHDDFYTERINWDALRAVAEQCPFKGGSVVYRARGLYMCKNPNLVYHDGITCATTGGKFIEKVSFNNKQSNFKVLIAPNPANDYVNISWNNNSQNRMLITLIDILGREVLKTEIREDNLFIDTAQYPIGTYQLKLRNIDNNQTYLNKIIINH